MSAPRLPLAIRILERCHGDNDALVGDLVEACPGRSRLWLWRQVLFAVVAFALHPLRTQPRATIEALLVGMAMLTLLGFHALVVASLINHLLVLNDTGWVPITGRFHQWQGWSVVPWFAVAIVLGRVIGRVHRQHRIAAVIAFGASASTAAFLNLLLFVPNVLLQPFVPYAALQTAIGMVFIGGLFVGIAWRPSCAANPSS